MATSLGQCEISVPLQHRVRDLFRVRSGEEVAAAFDDILFGIGQLLGPFLHQRD